LRPKNESWSTTDLVDWKFEHTSAVFSPFRPGRMISFNGKLWVLGTGMDGKFQAWSSPTGDEWTPLAGSDAVGKRTFFNVAIHDNRLWVQGGYANADPFDRTNDIWSTDGATWTRATADATFESRVFNAMFAMNGKLWVMGGYAPGSAQFADVWSSTDGATWQREIQFATPGAIYEHRVVVFNGRAWLLGGINTNGTDGRIWSSANGIDWQLETTHPQATGRGLMGVVVHDNKIWTAGGEDVSFMPVNDTWSSPDGINWTQATPDSGRTPHVETGMASFGGRLWLYGGEGTGGEDDSHDMMWSTDGTAWRHRYNNQIELP
jgi:leucine-zipper-like transcriptional regulator 1